MDKVIKYKMSQVESKLRASYENQFKDITTKQRYFQLFMNKYQNWIRGQEFLIHTGWWSDLNVLIMEYENFWNDEEVRKWL